MQQLRFEFADLAVEGHELLEGRVNLRVAFREPVTQFIRDALDLEIAACPIPDAIPEAAPFAGEFVVVGILGELPGTQQIVVLKRLLSAFRCIECRVENDAMRVRARVKSARRFVGEQSCREVADRTVVLEKPNG